MWKCLCVCVCACVRASLRKVWLWVASDIRASGRVKATRKRPFFSSGKELWQYWKTVWSVSGSSSQHSGLYTFILCSQHMVSTVNSSKGNKKQKVLGYNPIIETLWVFVLFQERLDIDSTLRCLKCICSRGRGKGNVLLKKKVFWLFLLLSSNWFFSSSCAPINTIIQC